MPFSQGGACFERAICRSCVSCRPLVVDGLLAARLRGFAGARNPAPVLPRCPLEDSLGGAAGGGGGATREAEAGPAFSEDKQDDSELFS